MKLLYLPVLIWTMAISPMFAQKTLPPSIEPYAVHWGYSTKLMLDAAGFEVPGPKPDMALLPSMENRSDELQLDSTVLYANYGQHATDSIPQSRNVYVYPSPEVTVITESFFDGKSWITLSRTTLISDEYGRLVETFAQLYDAESGEYIPDSRLELFPRGTTSTLIDSFFIYAWSVEINDWKRQLGTFNTFDAEDRLIESLSSMEFFDVPLLFLDRYTYHTDGKLSKVESFNLEAGDEIPAGQDEYGYTDGKVSSITTYVSDGIGGYSPQSRVEYTYTNFDMPENVESFEFDFEKNDWKLYRVDGYAYDNEERVILKEEITSNEQGIWVRHKNTFNYVQDEYLSRDGRYYYDNNAEAWILEEARYYFYNETVAVDPDAPGEVHALFIWPNPSTGIVQVKLPGKVSVQVYSLSGQLLKKFYLAPGERTLNLTALPAGLYQVRAKSDEDYFSGKLIIQ